MCVVLWVILGSLFGLNMSIVMMMSIVIFVGFVVDMVFILFLVLSF